MVPSGSDDALAKDTRSPVSTLPARPSRGATTKAGNTHAQRVLVDAAWHYRHCPTLGRALAARAHGQPTFCRAQIPQHGARESGNELELVPHAHRFGSRALLSRTFSVLHNAISWPQPTLNTPPPPHGHVSVEHLPNTSQQARAQAPVGVPSGHRRGVQSPQPGTVDIRSCGTTALGPGRQP